MVKRLRAKVFGRAQMVVDFGRRTKATRARKGESDALLRYNEGEVKQE
jgi:hypothetical protein